jgi:hypothetical protein
VIPIATLRILTSLRFRDRVMRLAPKEEAPALHLWEWRKRTLPQCEDRLIEIDHCGERLIGCVTCNCWMGEDKVLMQLDEADITALRGRVSPH